MLIKKYIKRTLGAVLVLGVCVVAVLSASQNTTKAQSAALIGCDTGLDAFNLLSDPGSQPLLDRKLIFGSTSRIVYDLNSALGADLAPGTYRVYSVAVDDHWVPRGVSGVPRTQNLEAYRIYFGNTSGTPSTASPLLTEPTPDIVNGGQAFSYNWDYHAPGSSANPTLYQDTNQSFSDVPSHITNTSDPNFDKGWDLGTVKTTANTSHLTFLIDQLYTSAPNTNSVNIGTVRIECDQPNVSGNAVIKCKADLWFANDESNSIDNNEFDDALDFMYLIADNFDFDDTNGVKAGLFGWDTAPGSPIDIIMPITENFDDEDDSGLNATGGPNIDGDGIGIRERYKAKVTPEGDGTDLVLATNRLTELINGGNGRRAGVDKFAIILTDAYDGQIRNNWIDAADNLRVAGEGKVTIVVILIDEASRVYDNGSKTALVDAVAGDGVVISVPSYADAADVKQPFIDIVTSSVCAAQETFFRVHGGDVLAGSSFGNNSCSAASNDAGIRSSIINEVGSATEYAARGSGLIEGFGTDDTAASNLEELAFANSPSTGHFSSCIKSPNLYQEALKTPDPAQNVSILSGSILNSMPSDGQYFITPPSGTLTINSISGITSTTTLVVDGDVRINGNISYASNYTNKNQIPAFLLIVNGNIIIDQAVTRLDGLYAAYPTSPGTKGVINTCIQGLPSNSGTSVCTKQLIVNGAFIARDIKFNRIFGSIEDHANQVECGAGLGPQARDKSCAAEQFNFSPEMYLANPYLVLTTGGASFPIDLYRDLPPVLE